MMKRSKRQYAPSAIELAGQRAWNEAWGYHYAASRRYFALAIAGVAVGGMGAGFACWRSAQPQAVPWLINKDGPLMQTAHLMPQIPDAARIVGHLQMWVAGMRTVSLDATYQHRLIDQTYAWVDGSSTAHDQLDQWYIAHNPINRAKASTTEVDVQSVVPEGGNVWLIDWKETERARDPGKLPLISCWRMTVNVKIQPPTTEQEVAANWDGVYAIEFHVNQQPACTA